MRYFFGEIEWLCGYQSNSPSRKINDPNIDGLLKFQSGPLCFMKSLDVNDYTIFEEDILGSQGRLKILTPGFEVKYYKIKESKKISGYKEVEEDPLPFNIPETREPLLEGVINLVNCVENKTESLSSGRDGYADLEATNSLIKSSQDNSEKIYL